MDNQEIIKAIKKYLRKYKTVDIKWFVTDKENGLGLQKNAREYDIIKEGVIDYPGFRTYKGHNPDDISIKYSVYSELSYFSGLWGGIIGLIGGILGIISFFK